MAQCAGIKRDGSRCSVNVAAGVGHCYNHDPHRTEERRRNAARAGRSRSNSEVSKLKDQLATLYSEVLAGLVVPKVGAVLAQIAGARIRLLEAERRIRETEDLESRLEALEEIQERRGGNRRAW